MLCVTGAPLTYPNGRWNGIGLEELILRSEKGAIYAGVEGEFGAVDGDWCAQKC